MAEIDRNVVHKGSGVVVYNGEQVGVVDEMAFMFHKIGLVTDAESEDTCYGTVTGKLTKAGVVDEFNSPRPTPSTLEITVQDPGKEPLNMAIDEVEFIDNIPSDGLMGDVEFHGIARV